MQIEEKICYVFWIEAKLTYLRYDEGDKANWKKLFDSWNLLNKWLKAWNARWANLPEWISEVAFCIATWSVRYLKVKPLNTKLTIKQSFDTYNLITEEAEQIKACSVDDDLTSFWPKSKWDKLYFLDFYRNWELDWSFDAYLIPNEVIKTMNVNKWQSFADQQGEKRRPRFSIKKEIIEPMKIQPVLKNVRVWHENMWQ